MKYKRGTNLLVQGGPFHGALVKYLRANVKGDKIAVQLQHDHGQTPGGSTPKGTELRFDSTQQFIKSAKRVRVTKQSGSRLILCRCPEEDRGCGLKIRVTANWLRDGATPRCFNATCPGGQWTLNKSEREYAGRELVIEWGERGDGVQHPMSAECARKGCEVCQHKFDLASLR